VYTFLLSFGSPRYSGGTADRHKLRCSHELQVGPIQGTDQMRAQITAAFLQGLTVGPDALTHGITSQEPWPGTLPIASNVQLVPSLRFPAFDFSRWEVHHVNNPFTGVSC